MDTLSKVIEVTEQSLESAIQLASAKLGVPVEELSIQVLEEKKRLFGKDQVRIRAEVVQSSAQEVSSELSESDAQIEEVHVEQEPAKQITASDEDARSLTEYLEKITELSKLKMKANLKGLSGRYVQFELAGEDVSYILERHGQPLNALQFIMNGIAAKKLANGVRVTLDASHYRTKREKALQDLAVTIAEEVKQRKEEAVLDELPAFERRVIHQTLQGYPGIVTYSEGEEPHRRVVIASAEE